mmetsp:Transcript_79570/g.145585  ORF Transcript_79570/g.145585 Transcript_79570/m.145585 type:complete len:245 (+) Transcript_79570:118-852(+)
MYGLAAFFGKAGTTCSCGGACCFFVKPSQDIKLLLPAPAGILACEGLTFDFSAICDFASSSQLKDDRGFALASFTSLRLAFGVGASMPIAFKYEFSCFSGLAEGTVLLCVASMPRDAASSASGDTVSSRLASKPAFFFPARSATAPSTLFTIASSSAALVFGFQLSQSRWPAGALTAWYTVEASWLALISRSRWTSAGVASLANASGPEAASSEAGAGFAKEAEGCRGSNSPRERLVRRALTIA